MFACFDSDDNFIIFDYQYPRVSERFRAVVNGAPMVVHLSPCSVFDLGRLGVEALQKCFVILAGDFEDFSVKNLHCYTHY